MSLLFSLYRRIVSPVLHFVSRAIGGSLMCGCRFEPTCSVYAEEAIRGFGFLKGSLKTAVRLSRCHPFSGRGGYDPV